MGRRLSALFLALILTTTGVFAGACSDDEEPRVTSPAGGITEVTRQVLQSAMSDTAPGQLVELQRVIIPAGQEIATHTHPGPQLAVVVEGTLTYTVIRGQVQVARSSGATEIVQAGSTTQVRAGDSLAEMPGMVHAGKNAGSTPVVIYLSSLFPAGAPASSPAQ
jgi:quercetin dioxygenase-like cupin family protein